MTAINLLDPFGYVMNDPFIHALPQLRECSKYGVVIQQGSRLGVVQTMCGILVAQPEFFLNGFDFGVSKKEFPFG